MRSRWKLVSILLPALLAMLLGSCRSLVSPQGGAGLAAAPERPTPESFFEAAQRGDLARLRELLSGDAGLLEARDADGWNALSYAAWNARQQVHAYLLAQGAEGNLFTEAALGPWESFLSRLGANPIAVSSRDQKHRASALIWAVRTGNQAGCELLASRGADLLARDREGNSAVHHAVLMDRLELLEWLLRAGADVEGPNELGRSPLHAAAASGSYEACRLLLERGASLDSSDEQGDTPLHLAAERGEFELCEYFLFLGARADRRNGGGQTAADLARSRGYDRVARLLDAHQ
jgi:ankyrin repeat protein